MIQDIGEHIYHNEYSPKIPQAESLVLDYRKRQVLVRKTDDGISFPDYREVKEKFPELSKEYRYLFAIDDVDYFWVRGINAEQLDGCSWETVESLRQTASRLEAFAGVTGFQLTDWYESRRFCPRCGKPMIHDGKERMMRCESCGQMEFPKICPAVIVGVINQDKILLTKYAGGINRRYALIAGFTEIGETVEETVAREVMEEVGVRVKNIRYYKSQPWSFSGSLLMGFFADLDGDDEIHLDKNELSVGEWHTRDEIPEDDGISLTREMMRVFKNGLVK